MVMFSNWFTKSLEIQYSTVEVASANKPLDYGMEEKPEENVQMNFSSEFVSEGLR
jgi:hypothetical protein